MSAIVRAVEPSDGPGAPIDRYAHLRRWQPGESGNPRGRGSDKLMLAAQIRRISQDGREMIDFLFAVMRGEPMPLPGKNGRNSPGWPQRPGLWLRMRAAELLIERAFGRVHAAILEPEDDDSTARQERLTLIAAMSQEDRDALRALLMKSMVIPDAAAGVDPTRDEVPRDPPDDDVAVPRDPTPGLEPATP
jgi:hypothetical protein